MLKLKLTVQAKHLNNAALGTKNLSVFGVEGLKLHYITFERTLLGVVTKLPAEDAMHRRSFLPRGFVVEGWGRSAVLRFDVRLTGGLDTRVWLSAALRVVFL